MKKQNDFARVDEFRHGSAFALLSEAQAMSRTFQSLSDNAKTVLMICKLCRQYHRGTDKDKNPKMLKGDPLCFYFSRSLQKRYGLGNPNRCRKALVELIQKGFIDVRENNGNRRMKNIYCFSEKWKLLDKGLNIELSPAAATFIN